MKYIKEYKEVANFKNCNFLKIGYKVKLSDKAKDWKCGNTTTPQYKVDNLEKDTEYTISNVTPILKVKGGDQQFVDIEGVNGSYPCWCFDII